MAAARLKVLEIHPRAERTRTRTGDHDRTYGPIRLEGGPGLEQIVVDLLAQGVETLLPIDRDDENLTSSLDLQLVAHR